MQPGGATRPAAPGTAHAAGRRNPPCRAGDSPTATAHAAGRRNPTCRAGDSPCSRAAQPALPRRGQPLFAGRLAGRPSPPRKPWPAKYARIPAGVATPQSQTVAFPIRWFNFPPSSQFPRHSGASRNLRAAMHSGFRRSEGSTPKAPKTKRCQANHPIGTVAAGIALQ